MNMMFKSKKEKKEDKINKSKEIIKREKKKIKEEKATKFRKSFWGKFLKKILFIKDKKEQETITIKEQLLSMIYFEILGFIICLLLLFVLTGGRNYIKLYSELKNLINTYDAITSNYYGDLDKKSMIDSAIEAMVSEAGDNYTTYTDEKETISFFENIDSTYEGIGCTIALKETGEIYVVSRFDNSPAAAAGIQENDILLKVDNKDFRGKSIEEISNYIKEIKKSKIKVTIKRGEEEKEITITRKRIEIPTITGEVINSESKKIGYIKISVFSAITYNQFKSKLTELEKENIQGLIIDVRNNTGGYLSSVTDITSMFLKKDSIIYQLENNKKTEKIKDKTKENRKYPIAVLINASSASASEILAASIKESYHGYVVGTNSYGKGTVQKTKKLSDGSMIKYTVEKWLTPTGIWINEIGVTPTDFIELKTAEDLEKEIETKIVNTTDKQLQKAIELIDKTQKDS